MNPIRCISLHQPWASLIACGAKTIETRGKPAPRTILGARIGIHAAATRKGIRQLIFQGHDDTLQAMEEALGIDYREWTGRLPFGALVATAVIEASIPTNLLEPDWFGDFSPGRYGWELSGIRPLPVPVPTKGKQGIFFVSPELLSQP